MKRPEQSQIDRLPKWAQEYIHNLEHRAKDAVQALHELKDGAPESDLLLERWVDPSDREIIGEPMRLAGSGVEFRVGKRNKITVRLSKGNHTCQWPGESVVVSAGNGNLQVACISGNMIEVKPI